MIDTVKRTDAADIRVVSPKSGWAALWRQFTRLGLLTLPDSSSLPRQEVMIADGESYVVEINHGNNYRTYEYSNPQFQRWPEAKKIVEIGQTLHAEGKFRVTPGMIQSNNLPSRSGRGGLFPGVLCSLADRQIGG